jgi:hypothetical protein
MRGVTRLGARRSARVPGTQNGGSESRDLHDGTSAALDVARFLTDGKNRTALLSPQRLPGVTIAGFRCSSGTGSASARETP